jgi:predicted phosphodiesterase
MSYSVWRLPQDGVNLAVLADCHIHAGGPQFPPALFERLRGVDLIVTLGNMGERSGLDQLQEIAPVLGVCGRDDSEDHRTRRAFLHLTGGGYAIGCVSDPRTAGLAEVIDPFIASEDAQAVSTRLFGGPVDILLHAGAGKPDEARFGPKGTALAPGSAALPPEGDDPTFLRLRISPEGCYGQVIRLAWPLA